MAKSIITEEIKRKRKAFFMFSPSLILLLIFFLGPILMAIIYSFTNKTLTGAQALNTDFVGIKNYIQIYKDPRIGKVFYNTLTFLLFSGIIGQQTLGFVVASLMKGKNRWVRSFVGFSIVAGWITPEIVASYMFSSFFNDKGVLNNIMGLFHIISVSWLTTYPMFSIIIANIWKGSAYSMMMYQAALDSISDDYIEAARIDGANAWRILTRIKLPMIKDTTIMTFIVVTLGTLGAFGLVYAMTGGGPGTSTTTLAIYMYQKAFKGYQIGYGMAIAMQLLAIGVFFSSIYIKIVNKNK